jgi:tellurite methyltransferase
VPHDCQHWNARHREAAAHPPPAPAPFLVECFPLLPRAHPHSRALDLACGAGQNAVWLAERRWPVLALDFSSAALDRALALASSRGIPVHRASPAAISAHFDGIVLMEADLENCPLPETAFDLILCFHYLHRPLFPAIERALAPGGHLLYETFTDLQLAHADGPRDPGHLLHPGELRSAFSHLEPLFYRECESPQAVASLLARKSQPR